MATSSRVERWVLCLSLANLCFLPTWSNLLDGWHSPYFEKYPSPALDALATMSDVLVLAALFGLAYVAFRGRTWGQALLRAGFAIVFVIAMNDIRQMIPQLTLPYLRARVGVVAVWVALMIAAAILATLAARWRRSLFRAATAVVLILFPFVAVCFGWASWRAVRFRSSESLADSISRGRSSAVAPRRVVWLIFDEMDQRLAFDQRPADLALPEFDHLRAESLVAQQAIPPANHTLLSMPALLSGRIVTRATPQVASQLLLTMDDGERASWTSVPGILAQANRMNVPTALVGWYHPYCRLFAAQLAACDWLPFRNREAHLGFGERMFQLAVYAVDSVPFVRRLELLERYGGGSDPMEASVHRDEMQTLLAAAQRDAADPTLGLVFLHLPLPHDPSMYDRRSGEYDFHPARKDWYLDNLALADKTLGDLRRAMESSGVWRNTTVLVSSDHSWRRSEQFDGQRDPRVPFILKLAGIEQGATYAPRMQTVVSAPLVLALLRGEVSTSEDVRSWLDRRESSGGRADPSF